MALCRINLSLKIKHASQSLSHYSLLHRTHVRCCASSFEHVTSTQNSYVKHCVKLRTNNKYRRQQGRTLLCGKVLVSEYTEAAGVGKVLLHTRGVNAVSHIISYALRL